jgi:hypothetical protein
VARRGAALTRRTARVRPRLFSPLSQELEARIVKVIEDYTEKLQLRTEHHMG